MAAFKILPSIGKISNRPTGLVYNLPKFDPMLDRGGPFHKYQTAATMRQLREKKLEIPIDPEQEVIVTVGAMEASFLCCAALENENLELVSFKYTSMLLPKWRLLLQDL